MKNPALALLAACRVLFLNACFLNEVYFYTLAEYTGYFLKRIVGRLIFVLFQS